MSATYNYTKELYNAGRFREEVEASSIITTAYRGSIWEEPDALQVFFESDLATEEETELDALVSSHTGDDPRDPPLTSDQEYQRLLQKVEALERIIIKQTSGMIDDFADSEGVDDTESTDIAVKDGYVRVADNQSSATLVTKTVETTNVKQKITVNKHMFEGDGDFYVSADDGVTWQQVTEFGVPISLSGKKYKVKANLNGSEKLALLAFDVE